MNESVPLSSRLPDEHISQLKALAIVDGDNLATQLRRAVSEYNVSRRQDPEFPAQVEAARVRLNGVLDTLLVDL